MIKRMSVTNGYCLLRSDKWRVHLMPKNEHMHVKITGPYGFRVQGLSSVKSDLTQFELKVAALHFWRLARDTHWAKNNSQWINHVNYAEIFGSCFD